MVSESHAHVDNSLFISCVDYHTLCGCAFAASHCIHTFDWLLTNVTMDNQSTNERINNLKLIYSDSYLSGGFIDKHLKLEEKKRSSIRTIVILNRLCKVTGIIIKSKNEF